MFNIKFKYKYLLYVINIIKGGFRVFWNRLRVEFNLNGEESYENFDKESDI